MFLFKDLIEEELETLIRSKKTIYSLEVLSYMFQTFPKILSKHNEA